MKDEFSMLISLSNNRRLFGCLVYCFLSCVQVESLLSYIIILNVLKINISKFCRKLPSMFTELRFSRLWL
jgi:hypothetical protein